VDGRKVPKKTEMKGIFGSVWEGKRERRRIQLFLYGFEERHGGSYFIRMDILRERTWDLKVYHPPLPLHRRGSPKVVVDINTLVEIGFNTIVTPNGSG